MVLTENQRRAARVKGLAKARAGMTKAERLHQIFVAGRKPESELRSSFEAVQAGSMLLRSIQERMKDPAWGMDPEEDVKVFLVTTDTNFTQTFTRPIVLGKEQELVAFLHGMPLLMLGLIFTISDKEAEDPALGVVAGMRAFVVTPRAVGWIRDLMESTKLED